MAAPGYAALILSVPVAARIDTTARGRAAAASAATSSSCPGLWHRTTTSARSASSAFDPTASPPSSSASALALASSTSCTSTGSPMPRASADAMFPAPIRPSFIAPEAYPAAASVPGGEDPQREGPHRAPADRRRENRVAVCLAEQADGGEQPPRAY